LAELELTLKLTEAAFRVFSSIFFDLFRAVWLFKVRCKSTQQCWLKVDYSKLCRARFEQGCPILLDTIYQNGGKYTKIQPSHQMAIKCIKWP
jgi:hypothetical protein